MPIDSTKEFKPINISVLTVSDTRTEATDKSGQILAKKIKEKGHGLAHKQIVKDEKEEIKKILLNWCNDKNVDVILATGGTGLTGRDTTPEALDEIKDKDIPGFGELFRLISYKKNRRLNYSIKSNGGFSQRYLCIRFARFIWSCNRCLGRYFKISVRF